MVVKKGGCMIKRLVIVLAILLIATSLFAAPVQIGGFSMTPVTKTLTGITDTTDTDAWVPASGQKIVLMGAVYSSGTASGFKVEAGGSSTSLPDIYNTASGCLVLGSGFPIWQGTDDEKLTYTVDLLPSDATYRSSYSLYLWGYETD